MCLSLTGKVLSRRAGKWPRSQFPTSFRWAVDGHRTKAISRHPDTLRQHLETNKPTTACNMQLKNLQNTWQKRRTRTTCLSDSTSGPSLQTKFRTCCTKCGLASIVAVKQTSVQISEIEKNSGYITIQRWNVCHIGNRIKQKVTHFQDSPRPKSYGHRSPSPSPVRMACDSD